ncbi:MAG: fumarylacetoacetate hydrolase family protein [Porticoccaceae bacterium]|nr:fumarylacetoacetate hydrolase family protein [Porticoccaceae bacterium]
MSYQHQFLDPDSNTISPCALPPGKVVCVGLNYAAHVAEMNSKNIGEPLLFIKPATALTPIQDAIRIPEGRGACHFESEMALLISQPLKNCREEDVIQSIAGVGIALDLTLRDLQKQLKAAGQPWEKAKGWDGACPISPFVKTSEVTDLQDVDIKLWQNGVLKQGGNTGQMLTKVLPLICYISQFFTLLPGDVVLTGTPEGVGPLQVEDSLKLELGGLLKIDTGRITY